ncbi:MAG: trp operon repressor [Actinomycetota bacterium]|nr:trp operon repressor [Actinomycetota bacterium]
MLKETRSPFTRPEVVTPRRAQPVTDQRRALLVRLYHDEQMSMRQVAAEAGASITTVARVVRDAGVARSNKKPA